MSHVTTSPGAAAAAQTLFRVALGGVLIAHGSQKLFGWFGGGGIRGTNKGMHAMGFRPAKPSAILAGVKREPVFPSPWGWPLRPPAPPLPGWASLPASTPLTASSPQREGRVPRGYWAWRQRRSPSEGPDPSPSTRSPVRSWTVPRCGRLP